MIIVASFKKKKNLYSPLQLGVVGGTAQIGPQKRHEQLSPCPCLDMTARTPAAVFDLS